MDHTGRPVADPTTNPTSRAPLALAVAAAAAVWLGATVVVFADGSTARPAAAIAALAGAGAALGFSELRARRVRAPLRADNERLASELARAHGELRDTRKDLRDRIRTHTAELRAQHEQLQHTQKMEAIGALAGGVAHDFNNLLTVIIAYSKLALDAPAVTGQLREDITEIVGAAERAEALTSQLLAFSRKQVRKIELLRLNDVVTQLGKMMHRLCGERIEIEIETAPDLGWIRADAGQLEQMLLNLVMNAKEAMPQGGRLVIQTANAELDDAYAADNADASPGPHVVLTITDTGHGMSADTRARMFEPFFTTKAHVGTAGLGLPTVDSIVRQNGGHIWVHSAEGKGTVFRIYFPRLEESPSSRMRLAAPREWRSDETILLVDDDAAIREVVHRMLAGWGYRVLIADGGEQALQKIRAHAEPIHLMITDVMMPRMTGAELAEEVHRIRPEIRVLYISGYSADEVADEGVLPDETHVLDKPFDPNQLLAAVRKALAAAAA